MPPLKKWMEKVVINPNQFLPNVLPKFGQTAFGSWCAHNTLVSQPEVHFLKTKQSFAKCIFQNLDKQHSAFGVHTKPLVSQLAVLFLIISPLLPHFAIPSQLLGHFLNFKHTFSTLRALSHLLANFLLLSEHLAQFLIL